MLVFLGLALVVGKAVSRGHKAAPDRGRASRELNPDWKDPHRLAPIPVIPIPGTNLVTGTFYTIENSCGYLANSVQYLVECTHDPNFGLGGQYAAAAEWMILPTEEKDWYNIVNRDRGMNKIYVSYDYAMVDRDYNSKEHQQHGIWRESTMWSFSSNSEKDPSVHLIKHKSYPGDSLIFSWSYTPHGYRNVPKTKNVDAFNTREAQWKFTIAGYVLDSRLTKFTTKESIQDIKNRYTTPSVYHRQTVENTGNITIVTVYSQEEETSYSLELSFAQTLGVVQTISFDLNMFGLASASSETSISAEVQFGQKITNSTTRKKKYEQTVTVLPFTCTDLTYIRNEMTNAQLDFVSELSVNGITEGMTWGGKPVKNGVKPTGEAVRHLVEVTGFQGKFLKVNGPDAIYELTGKMTVSSASIEFMRSEPIPFDKCKKQ